jgi:hypothetical protein
MKLALIFVLGMTTQIAFATTSNFKSLSCTIDGKTYSKQLVKENDEIASAVIETKNSDNTFSVRAEAWQPLPRITAIYENVFIYAVDLQTGSFSQAGQNIVGRVLQNTTYASLNAIRNLASGAPVGVVVECNLN